MSEVFQTTVLAALTGLRSDLDQVKTGQVELRAGLEEVKAGQNALMTGQVGLRADVDELRTDLGQLRAEFNTRIDDLRDRQTQMRVDIMHRMEAMQDAVTAIRGDITVNNATAYSAREANEHTRDEVRTLAAVLNGVQLQVQRLQSEVQSLRGEAG